MFMCVASWCLICVICVYVLCVVLRCIRVVCMCVKLGVCDERLHVQQRNFAEGGYTQSSCHTGREERSWVAQHRVRAWVSGHCSSTLHTPSPLPS